MYDCSLQTLLERASTIPNVDYKVIAKIISEDIDNDKDDICIYKDVYKHIFDGHLQVEECESFINHLREKDKEGSIWTLEESNSVAKRLDYDFAKKPYTKEEFRVAMHLQYYRLYYPLKESNITLESTVYGRLADFYFTSESSKECDLIHEYFHMICDK